MDSQSISVWIVLGITIAFIAIDKARKLFKNSGNPGYGERIARLETNMKNVKEDIQEIRKKLNNIR